MFSWQSSARGWSGADPRFGEVRVFSCQEPEQSGTKGEADDSPGQIAEGKQSSVSDPLRSLRLPSASPHAICLGAILAVPGSGFAYGSAGESRKQLRALPEVPAVVNLSHVEDRTTADRGPKLAGEGCRTSLGFLSRDKDCAGCDISASAGSRSPAPGLVVRKAEHLGGIRRPQG